MKRPILPHPGNRPPRAQRDRGNVRLRRRLLAALALALGVIVLGAWLIVANQDTIRSTLASWTGEEDLKEQIKGTLSLAYLNLTRFPPRTDPYVPLEHSGLPPFGVNTFLEQEPDVANVERSLQLIADAGFSWIRQEFPWEDIEISAKGDYWDHKWGISAWDKYDRIVDLANHYGLEIIARLDNPPAWSRSMGDAPGWTMAPPDDPQDYADFVAAVVSRYKGRIRYYQIWNEPNIFPEWGDQPANPAAYVELLKLAYQRAKEIDPHCVIIAAGLAQTTEETPEEFGPRNMSDLLYLEKMYQAGVQGHFDIMGAQVYGLWTGPLDRRVSREHANFSRVQLLREIMVRHGDAHKPIWATEVGWNAIPEALPVAAVYGRVSEAQQAQYAVQAYQRAAREWPWLGVMNYWFFRRPSDAERGQSWYYFRMLEPDWTPLPVYDALATLTLTPTVGVGFHQEDHWALHYEGLWEHVQDTQAVQGAYAAGYEGDELRFHFQGDNLALALRDASQLENLDIWIDGARMRAMRPWAVPQTGIPVIPVARNLRDTRHTAEIRVREGSVAIDGIMVWRRGPVAWIWVSVCLALVALAAILCGIVRLAMRKRGTHAG